MSELLIAGGLTIDRFADGTTAPGGSVLHAGSAAAAMGVRPAFLTVAGPEPEATTGIERLEAIGDVRHAIAASTTRFAHAEQDGRRVLVYEAAGGSIEVPPGGAPPVDVLLAAPIADELPAARLAAVRAAVRPRLTVMLIQGWLRCLLVGSAVHPLRLDDIDDSTWTCFADADALVVSTEDLAEQPEDPFAQAADLRARLGRGPILVLTLGPEGHLLDDPAADRVFASMPRRIVSGVPTVGAGDTFGAALALHLGRGDPPDTAAVAATDRVIALLESRQS